MTKSDSIPIGIDLGASSTKVFIQGRGALLLSQLAISNTRRLSRQQGLGKAKSPLEITLPDGRYFVGENAHDCGLAIENLCIERFKDSFAVKPLLCGGLTKHIQQVGPLTTPLTAICGLPLESLSTDQVQATIDGVQRCIRGTHTWQAGDQPYSAEISDVRVTSQPVGAWFDSLLDDEGCVIPSRRDWLSREVGVISIGMSTVEMMVVRNKAPVERFTAGVGAGVRRLLELADRQGLYSIGELDTMLRTGRLDIHQAKLIWQEEIEGQIDKRWGPAWRRFAAVVLVGGGVHILNDRLPYFFGGKAFVPAEPVMAVARGLAKLGMMKSLKRG